MNALIRDGDRAILAVDRLAIDGTGARTVVPVSPQDGARVVELTALAWAHWDALVIPPGEVMALGEDGTIFVLVPAPPDPREAELAALADAHPDPLVRELARRAGIGGAP